MNVVAPVTIGRIRSVAVFMGAEVASWAREQIGAPTSIVFETGDIVQPDGGCGSDSPFPRTERDRR